MTVGYITDRARSSRNRSLDQENQRASRREQSHPAQLRGMRTESPQRIDKATHPRMPRSSSLARGSSQNVLKEPRTSSEVQKTQRVSDRGARQSPALLDRGVKATLAPIDRGLQQQRPLPPKPKPKGEEAQSSKALVPLAPSHIPAPECCVCFGATLGFCLPCSHGVCLGCVMELLQRQAPTCPLCRKEWPSAWLSSAIPSMFSQQASRAQEAAALEPVYRAVAALDVAEIVPGDVIQDAALQLWIDAQRRQGDSFLEILRLIRQQLWFRDEWSDDWDRLVGTALCDLSVKLNKGRGIRRFADVCGLVAEGHEALPRAARTRVIQALAAAAEERLITAKAWQQAADLLEVLGHLHAIFEDSEGSEGIAALRATVARRLINLTREDVTDCGKGHCNVAAALAFRARSAEQLLTDGCLSTEEHGMFHTELADVFKRSASSLGFDGAPTAWIELMEAAYVAGDEALRLVTDQFCRACSKATRFSALCRLVEVCTELQGSTRVLQTCRDSLESCSSALRRKLSLAVGRSHDGGDRVPADSILALRLLRAVETFAPEGYDPPLDVSRVGDAAKHVLRSQLSSSAPPRKALPASAPSTVFLTSDDAGIVEEAEDSEPMLSAVEADLIETLRSIAKLKYCFEGGVDVHGISKRLKLLQVSDQHLEMLWPVALFCLQDGFEATAQDPEAAKDSLLLLQSLENDSVLRACETATPRAMLLKHVREACKVVPARGAKVLTELADARIVSQKFLVKCGVI